MGQRLAEVRNPYDDVIDWSMSTEDSLVRIKPNGQRVRHYQNCTGYPVYPMPIMSPVFSSYYNYGPEFAIEPAADTESPPPPADARRTFRLHGAGSPGTEVFYANGPGYGWEDPGRMWMVLVRRRDRAAHFMVAMDAFRDAPYVESVEALLREPAAAAMRVVTTDSVEVFVSSHTDQPIETEALSLSARFGAISSQGRELSWALVVDGTHLRVGGWQIESPQPNTFLVTRDRDGQLRGRTGQGRTVPVRVTPTDE